MILVCSIENPLVIESIKNKFYTDIFRNFVDLCVTKNYQIRLNATQLLQHFYVKKLPRKDFTDFLKLIIAVMHEKFTRNKSN